MSILPLLLASIIGAFLFLFVFWRRLKEDYSPALIFNSAFLSIFLICSFSLVAIGISKLAPDTTIFRPSQMWFWSSILGLLVSLRIAVSKFRLKMIETFEASILGTMLWILVLFIVESVVSGSIQAGVLAIITAILIYLFFFLDKKYRSFQWYKSGKVGFSGLAVAGIFFLARIFLSYFEPNTFSIIGKVDVVISAATSFLIFFSLYNLSEA